MPIGISDPRTDAEGLTDLAPLWGELHRHHRQVSAYRGLVEDPDSSWASRLRWYRRVIADGGSYVTATDDRGRLIGYAMVAVETGPDDTFDVTGGMAEVITLIVSSDQRSAGLGRALLAAAEDIARNHGFDTVKVAVMNGNGRALQFYETNGYSVAEHILYRRLDDP
ncbi:MAG: GNAT family N-acetyltransferase [Solirubrobacteraceae bacterium]